MTNPADPLSPAQLDELREEIQREIARIERGMEGARESSKPVQLDQSAVGRLSRIDPVRAHSRRNATIGSSRAAFHAG